MVKFVNFDISENLKFGYYELPQHFCETIEHFLVRGYEPGGFVTSMLAKDYERALCIADTANRQRFWHIATWIKDTMPEGSWGSYEAVDAWCHDVDGCRTKWVTWRTLESVNE